MNAYSFQMNNLKGLAEDESGNTMLEARLARSDRFTVGSSVRWTCSAERERVREKKEWGHLDNSPRKPIGPKLLQITSKLQARFVRQNTTFSQLKK